jgi:uncharacterized membrane protein
MMMNRFDEIPNSKDEFLQSLEMLLAPLSETERKDALSFYLEYFDEAGSENEMSVLKQLGSPKSVADKILSESGYVTEVDEEKNEGENDKKEETIKSNTPISNTKSSITKNPALLILIVIAAILTFPIWIYVIGVIIGLIGALIGILFGIFGAALGLLIGGIVTSIVGAVAIASSVFDGLLALGIGLVMFGIGLLLIPLLVKLCVTVIPAVIRFVIDIVKLPFRRKVNIHENVV